jgi:tRNA-2-methylthio-N6-dimethylallyladenosine synthase
MVELMIMKRDKSKYLLTTFGCQMNQADAQRIHGILASLGYQETQDEKEANLILFNTCCVRQHAEQRLISRIQALNSEKKNRPDLLIGVAGCMAQNLKEEMLEILPLVDLVFGPNDIEQLPLLLQRSRNEKTMGNFAPKGAFDGESADGIILNRPFSAMVNIIRGCTNFCAYCIVPFVRGPEISRPIDELKAFISELAGKGVSEITLLGQNVNAYGKDLGLKEGFAQLLEEIEKIDGIRWVRFLTSHPRDFTDETIERISQLNKVCEQYHLPVQAGSNRVLKAMKRGYTREKYLDLIAKVRSKIKDVSLSTDIICGFPGETEEDFEQTLSLVKKVRYESAFMYYYSPREGTEAAEMKNQIPEAERKERLARLIDLQNNIALEESQKQLHRELEVLVDSVSSKKQGHVAGKTRSGRVVDFAGPESLIGSYVKVRIDRARIWTLSGTLVQEAD